LFPSLREKIILEKEKERKRGRTNANNGAIFRLFVVRGNGRWTEEDEGEEEEEGKGERRE
jgi:hypothetical protein